MPGIGENLTDEDLRRAISVFIPKELRPAWKGLLTKWDQLALLARSARLGMVPSETIRTEYTRRKSAKAKERKAEQEELTSVPLRTKWDHLQGAERERVKKRILEIEAKALASLLRARATKKP